MEPDDDSVNDVHRRSGGRSRRDLSVTIWSMSGHDSFEDRLRALADEISRSVQRISELDMEELSRRYGVDADRARGFADAAERWLSDHLFAGDPLFGRAHPADDDRAGSPFSEDRDVPEPAAVAPAPRGAGPHPLDVPSDPQGVALSALDSGRWTVGPGGGQLDATGPGGGPAPSDVVGELRARDWITVDGTLTLVGRHALGRWCRAQEAGTAAPPPDTPPV